MKLNRENSEYSDLMRLLRKTGKFKAMIASFAIALKP